jgi:hypothetical protein
MRGNETCIDKGGVFPYRLVRRPSDSTASFRSRDRSISWEDAKMKYAIVALLLAFSVTEADAVVYCAAGAYHAGCVRRPAGGAVVVAPAARCRTVVVNGIARRRCY